MFRFCDAFACVCVYVYVCVFGQERVLDQLLAEVFEQDAKSAANAASPHGVGATNHAYKVGKGLLNIMTNGEARCVLLLF